MMRVVEGEPWSDVVVAFRHPGLAVGLPRPMFLTSEVRPTINEPDQRSMAGRATATNDLTERRDERTGPTPRPKTKTNDQDERPRPRTNDPRPDQRPMTDD